MALSHIHTVCNSLHRHCVLSVCCPIPVIWYRLPTADFPLPGLLYSLRPTATTTLISHCSVFIFWNCHLLSSSVLSGTVPTTAPLELCPITASTNGFSKSKSKSKLYYDRRSVGQSVLVSGTHLGHAANFFPYSL
jgi:hypothetical protein